ncbi:hypothetical protein [Flavobacterium beibuense]|uniref:hypothetical protein n=1 Tax=Flavobacterium beibuense TaxID=657326 RepID=UPI003A93B1FE
MESNNNTSEKKSSKRFEILISDKVIKRSDSEVTIMEKIKELQLNNEKTFTLKDNETGQQSFFTKETYQKNYRVTKYNNPKNKQQL